MSETLDGIALMHEPSPHAKLAVGLSLGAMAGLVIACVTFGAKIGAREENLVTLQRDVEVLKVDKADKATIEAKLDAIQQTLADIKEEERRRRTP